MEWIDTLMLGTNRKKLIFDHRQIDESPMVDAVKAVSARVLAVQGVSLIHATGRDTEELAAALEILRGFRATGRRIVLCDTSQLTPGRQIGSSLVEIGGAEEVVTCGSHGRDMAIGARDAGLDLGRVVVCRDVKSACEALIGRLSPGDTVLLWGVNQETCIRLVNWLESSFSGRAAAAAA